MCGIAGWYARGDGAPGEAVARQCAAITHRGPDDQGMLVDGDFAFGMRRLSIVDIAGGHQPIETEDGRYAIVFNGEVYNYEALRRELSALGHSFRTAGDTEAILLAYRQWGEDAWRRLDGMFAVAIWDRRERRLTLARDPLGIKPLYLTEQRGGLAFGSELKTLTALPRHRFGLSPRAVHDFFSYGHIRADRSIYAEVRTLRPGHSLVIGPDGDAVERPFSRLRYRSEPARDDEEWVEEFRRRWLATVESHLLGDVPVGAFLSGGVDSSAVVAAMARLSGRPVKTFTIGFPIARYDESPYAEAVARHLGCDHVTRMIDLADARHVLPDLARAYDEPFADPSAVPTWHLSRLAAEHVKVALSGDGGDELFMGYKRHLTEATLARLPGYLRGAAQGVLRLPATPNRQVNRAVQRWQRAVGTAGLPDGASRFFAKTQVTSRALRARILSPALIAGFDGADAFARLRDEHFGDPAATISASDLEQFAYADLTLNLPAAMLTKIDRASMAHSLEVRVPLLSPGFVDWALGVPTRMKVRDGVGKHVMRQAIAPWVPDEVIGRRKQGFQIPLAEWFDGDFARHARELWEDSGVADLGVLERSGVESLFREQRDGVRDHGRTLYALSMFAHWWMARGASVTTARDAAARIAATPPAAPAAPPAANDDASARRGGRRRAVGWAAAMLLGWLLHDAVGSFSEPAQASVFVDEAVRSHRITLLRAGMRSQLEARDYDRAELTKATGIDLPPLPADWSVRDVQLYPSDTGLSVEVAVATAAGERFSLFGMRADTPGGERPSTVRRQASNVVYWEEGENAFALVSAIPTPRLLRLAARVDRP